MNALDRLGERAGLLPEYHDIWGRAHPMSDASRRALLEAMGMPCADAPTAEASLQDWETRAWQRCLPPVRVVKAGEPAQVILRLPAARARQDCHWRLDLEQGGTRTARFVANALSCLDSRHLDGQDWHAYDLPIAAIAETGYHRFVVCDETGAEMADMALIVTPAQCYQPPAIGVGKRVWGVSVQLYGVRSTRNWGMGDFTDLRHLVEWAVRSGASLVGINPLHALFPDNPRHASPYSPSSRRFFNLLYLDVEAVPEFAQCVEARQRVASLEFQARLQTLRAAPLVDHAGVAAAKSEILEMLHRHFRTHPGARLRDFQDWCAVDGSERRRFALYHALQDDFRARDDSLWGWPVWPQAYRDPDSPEVAAFADQHGERVAYHLYLQWLAEEQIAAVGELAEERGLDVGLYRDLAVGVDLAGAETWSRQHLFALGARIGSPPDDFNPHGQDWGLPPWVPQRLREAAYAPYIAMLRANMRGGGALRLDHVMGLLRLFWVPPAMRGDQGGYVVYPFDDLLGILALESQRHRCLVVGEDLGTVPDAVRAAMRARGLLSYRLLYFERDVGSAFQDPASYPEQAVVAASTHDLPTLAGFWQGVDIDLRARLGLLDCVEAQAHQHAVRAEDRQRLLQALARTGMLPEGLDPRAADAAEMSPALMCAIHRYLARSPARIALVQAEDMLGEREQANLPGTTEGHPNWQRKLSLDLEDWLTDPRPSALAQAMNAERG